MAKSIHQQIIDGNGEIHLKGVTLDFDFPDCMSTIPEEYLQNADKLVEFFKTYTTEEYPNGILLNMFHQAFGQTRVNWSAEVKRQAVKMAKDLEISEAEAFQKLQKDCAIDWIPPVQGLPKDSKAKVAIEKAEDKGAQLVITLATAGVPVTDLVGKTAKQLEELATSLGIEI